MRERDLLKVRPVAATKTYNRNGNNQLSATTVRGKKVISSQNSVNGNLGPSIKDQCGSKRA